MAVFLTVKSQESFLSRNIQLQLNRTVVGAHDIGMNDIVIKPFLALALK